MASDEARGQFAVRRNIIEGLVVVVESQPAAAGLLQELNFQVVAFDLHEHRLARARRVDADAAQSEPTIAAAGAQSGAYPAGRGAAARVEPAVAGEGMAGH